MNASGRAMWTAVVAAGDDKAGSVALLQSFDYLIPHAFPARRPFRPGLRSFCSVLRSADADEWRTVVRSLLESAGTTQGNIHQAAQGCYSHTH
jgi:hypothetical protein